MATAFVVHMYHPEGKESDFPLSVQLDDHWWHLVPGDVTEIESEFYAEKLVEIYGPIYGIIRIEPKRTRGGISYNIEAAEEAALADLARVEEILLTNWVRDQQDTRIALNLNALPPAGRVAEIIIKHKIDLKKKFNLDVMGNSVLVDSEKEQLKRDNAQLREQIASNSSALDAIMARLTTMEAAATAPKK